MKIIAIAVIILILAFSLECRAGDENVKFALHLATHGASTCKALPSISGFSDITSNWLLTGPGSDVDVFFVVFDYDSILTLEYGLDWPAEWGTGAFSVCPPAITIGGIVSPGDGVAMTYSDCQLSASNGGSRPNFWTMCWTWLTPLGYGDIELIPNPATGDMEVVDCRDPYNRRRHYPVAVYNASVSGEPPEIPVCSVEPESLDFGTLVVGQGSTDHTFTITNVGQGGLGGSVTEACAAFSIVSGGGSYWLEAGESRTVTVRFAPPTAGAKNCSMQTGTLCLPVICTGIALPPPTCEVNPTKLNFGVVGMGQYADLTVTIANIGAGTLEGVLADTCAAFSVVGDSAYSLGQGQSKVFTVRFSPLTSGVQTCKVKGTNCTAITCTGEGTHFSSVSPTGNAQPVVIQAATMDGLPLVKGDEVGVFDGTLCVGTTKFAGTFPLPISAWMQVQLPDGDQLPGAVPGHAITFRTWQSTYSRECSAGAAYVSGTGTFGEPATVVSVLQSMCPSQAINVLERRMNLISMNFRPYDLSASKVFADLTTLQVAKDDAGKFYLPQFGVNTIGKVDVCKAYQLFIGGTQPGQMMVEGTPLDPTACCYTWDGTRMYAVGVPYQSPQPVADVFASIGSKVVVVQDDGGRYWIPGHGINTIGNMLPGRGYQVFVNAPVSGFCYPSLPVPANLVGSPPEAASRTPTHFNFQATGMSEAVVISASDAALSAGDEIAVFDGSTCVGATVFEGTLPTVVAAWQGDAQWDLEGFTSGNPITLRLWKKGESTDLLVESEFAGPADSVFGGAAVSDIRILSVTGTELPGGSGEIRISSRPNPFESSADITYEIPSSAHVSLVIYDTRGRVIRRLADAFTEAGAHHATWDGSDDKGRSVATGIYFCRLTSGQKVAMGTIVVAR